MSTQVVVNGRFLTQRMSGVQRYAIELSTHVREICPGARFVCPRDVLHKDVASLLRAEPVGRRTDHVWEQIELPAYLEAHGRPLLVNLTALGPIRYPRQILVLHDVAFLRHPEWYAWKASLYYRLVIPMLARRALAVITDSRFSKDEIVRLIGLPESKVTVIYPGVPEKLQGLAGKRYENRYGDYILAVSSLDPRKNFRNLILAYNRLGLTGVKLVIAGGGSPVFARHDTACLVRGNSGIAFPGYVSDEELAGLYQHARVFIYPSLYEGFGLPPLEAMCFGCPVVVSRAASLPEVCGEAAVYVNPEDVQDIADKLRQVLNDGAGVERSRQRQQLSRFTWDAAARQHISVWNSALS